MAKSDPLWACDSFLRELSEVTADARFLAKHLLDIGAPASPAQQADMARTHTIAVSVANKILSGRAWRTVPGYYVNRMFEVARETGDEILTAYANDALRGEDWDDLVFRMMRTFAENRRYILETYRKSIMDRPVVIPYGVLYGENFKGGGPVAVIIDEARNVERSIISNGDIFFMDFLRSFWRRLTRRFRS